MKNTYITGKELITRVLKETKKPLSVTDIWNKAVKNGYAKLYAHGTDVEQKKRQIGSTLSRWYQEEDSPLERFEKGVNGNNISYSFRKNPSINGRGARVPIKPKGVEYSRNRKTIDKNIRNNVWRRYWGGNMDGKCWVCERPIEVGMFECGHIVSKSKGGNDNILNLIPICRGCNSGMKEENLLDYKKRAYAHIRVNSLVHPKHSKQFIEEGNDPLIFSDIYDPPPIKIEHGDGISSFNFDGNKYNVSKWKDLLIKVIECILQNHKREFDNILDIKGIRGGTYFSKDPKIFEKPFHIENTNIYVETNLDAKNIVRICYYIIRKFGYTNKHLKIIKKL